MGMAVEAAATLTIIEATTLEVDTIGHWEPVEKGEVLETAQLAEVD